MRLWLVVTVEFLELFYANGADLEFEVSSGEAKEAVCQIIPG
jgi:hypothetical protein